MGNKPKKLSTEAAQPMRPAQRMTVPITRSSRITRLSGLIFLAGRARRTLWVLAAVLLLTAAPRVGKADYIQTVAEGLSGGISACGYSACCFNFNVYITSGTCDEIDINLTGGTSDACYNWTCFTGQSTSSVTFTHTATGHIVITFSPPLLNYQTFQFYLCPINGDANNCETEYNSNT